MADKLLFNLRKLVKVAKRDLRLNHPKFGEVAAGFAFLGAEGGAKAIHFAKRKNVGFVVKLASLRQVGFVVKIAHLKQVGRALGGGWGEDGRGHLQKAVPVQPAANGAHDRGPHAQNGPLARGSNPQMAVVQQKFHAVLFGGDGVLLRLLHHAEGFYAHLKPARHTRRARIGANFAGQGHAALLRDVQGGVKSRLVHIALKHHRLANACAIAHLQKYQLALVGSGVNPALQGHRLPNVAGQVFD